MKHLTWTTVDKSAWPRGPWDQEPDKEQWVDPETGLPCLIVRGPLGALCGYVGVPEGHPATEKTEDLEVHGGVTYGPSPCSGGDICHIPDEGEPDHVFWIGFDCSHRWDFAPGFFYAWGGEYRDIAYVKNQCALLARQIKDLLP